MGRVVILGGSVGLGGAVILAARAALRAGAGLVTAALPRSIHTAFAAACPESMTLPLPDDDDGALTAEGLPKLLPLLERAQALVLGPGLGRAPATGALVAAALARFTGPHVIDADGLWHLAEDRARLAAGAAGRVLTPHAGEFARLRAALGQPDGEPEAEVRAFARAVPGVLVRKGPGSWIAEGERVARNSTGNPGMAKGGSGDVLSGVIGALLGRGDPPLVAARRGVWLHGRAGDRARDRLGAESMIATDIIDELPAAFLESAGAPDGGV
jgi:NAD(P)H-hydrate epimerase